MEDLSGEEKPDVGKIINDFNKNATKKAQKKGTFYTYRIFVMQCLKRTLIFTFDYRKYVDQLYHEGDSSRPK